MQTDLDVYFKTYNRNRPHGARGMDRRTPYQVFKKRIPKPRSRKKSTSKEGQRSQSEALTAEAGCQVITVLVQVVG